MERSWRSKSTSPYLLQSRLWVAVCVETRGADRQMARRTPGHTVVIAAGTGGGTMSQVPAQTFEKIAVFGAGNQQLGIGTLTAYPDRLVIEGKRVNLTLTNVRDIAVEEKRWQADAFAASPRIRVTHGTGNDLAVTYLVKSAAGLPKKVRALNDEFFAALQAIYGQSSSLPAADQQRLASVDAVVQHAELRRAQRSIWIGLALLVGGVLLTVLTYSNASGGGSYIVAYGPVLAGVGMLAVGLLGRAKARKASAQLGSSG